MIRGEIAKECVEGEDEREETDLGDLRAIRAKGLVPGFRAKLRARLASSLSMM